MNPRRTLMMLVSALPLFACEGLVTLGGEPPGVPGEPGLPGLPGVPAEPGGPTPGGTEAAPFACPASSAEDLLEPMHARRLSQRQLQRTLTDVFGRILGATRATPLVTSALAATTLPPDTDRYKRWSNDFSSVHAQGYFVLADTLAKSVSSTTSYDAFIKGAVDLDKGTCATLNAAAPSVECQKQLIRNLALRLLRRPLVEGGAQDEVEDYRREYASVDAATALGNLVFRMLLSPSSLFHLEVNEKPFPGRTDVLSLSSHAIANRLSYTFWNAPPDDELLARAQSTDLGTDDGYAAALEYVVAKQQRFQDSTAEFFGDWLRLEEVPQFQSNNPTAFAVFAGNVRYDAALRDELVNEVRELGAFTTNSGGTFKDLFTTEVSFARGPELMKLYGVTSPAPAELTLANVVALPSGKHPGLLTRAAMLVTGSGSKNPVLRGMRVRHDILCMPTPPPPANLPADAFAAPPFNVNLTSRERYALKTSVQPCNGCHTVINPPGFALSNYNGLGRYETTEPAFAEDGAYTGKQLPVDATVDLAALFGSGTKSQTPAEFATLVGEQPQAKKCFSQEYAKYFLGREISDKDGCRLNRLYGVLREGKSLKEGMQSLARDPAFRLRKL